MISLKNETSVILLVPADSSNSAICMDLHERLPAETRTFMHDQEHHDDRRKRRACLLKEKVGIRSITTAQTRQMVPLAKDVFCLACELPRLSRTSASRSSLPAVRECCMSSGQADHPPRRASDLGQKAERFSGPSAGLEDIVEYIRQNERPNSGTEFSASDVL
jgi:hypothetical protein